MTELKCPFCGKDMEITMFARGREFVSCNNADCIISDWGGCSKQIIIALIDTKKKLEYVGMILKNLLPHLNGYERLDVQKAIKKINQKGINDDGYPVL